METNFKNNLAPAVIELNRMNEELQAENSQLKKDLEHARSYKHTIKMRNRNLHTENERLKAELQQTEAQDQVVIDGLRKENEQLKGYKDAMIREAKTNYKLLNENAKLKCLVLHAMSEYFDAVRIQYDMQINRDDYDFGNHVNKDVDKRNDYKGLAVRYKEAYRNAKKALREGK